MKILIVEDERPIANLIDLNLSSSGYRCCCAYDGVQAADLNTPKKSPPSIEWTLILWLFSL